MRNLSTLLAAAALAALSACASGNDVQGILGSGGGGCVRCHGGMLDQSGAPPLDAHGATSSAAVGAHQAHLGAGVACAACHRGVSLTDVGFPGHGDGAADVDFDAVAIDPSGVASPAYDASTHTCSNVYCHGASTIPTADRGPDFATTTAWTAPPGSIAGCGACHLAPSSIHGGALTDADCATCHATSVGTSGALLPQGGHLNGVVDRAAHPADWATGTGTVAHGLAATYQDRAAYPRGFEGCKTCHGPNLNDPPSSVVPSCDSAAAGCHGDASWRTRCTFCHGDATRANLSLRPAPPRDAAGRSASARVGAHLVHLTGDSANTPAVSDGILCSDCHGGADRALPTDFVHANGTTAITLKRPGQAAELGSYDPATGTCSSTYCHGNLPNNPRTPPLDPSWTATVLSTTNRGCDACHAPQTWASSTGQTTDGHARHRHGCAPCHSSSTSRTDCDQCHPGYSRPGAGTQNGTLSTGTHVNGAVNLDPSLNWNPTTRQCASPSCHTATGDHPGPGTRSW